MNFKQILAVFVHVVLVMVCKHEYVVASEYASTETPETVTKTSENHQELVEQGENSGKKLLKYT